jgi:hypothetical protein
MLLTFVLQMFKTVFKEVNVGFGHVDQLQYPTSSALYPVEQLYLQPSPVPGRVQHDADLKTTNRMSYKPRCVRLLVWGHPTMPAFGLL